MIKLRRAYIGNGCAFFYLTQKPVRRPAGVRVKVNTYFSLYLPSTINELKARGYAAVLCVGYEAARQAIDEYFR